MCVFIPRVLAVFFMVVLYCHLHLKGIRINTQISIVVFYILLVDPYSLPDSDFVLFLLP